MNVVNLDPTPLLERGPDEEGIETRSPLTLAKYFLPLERGPDEEGIET